MSQRAEELLHEALTLPPDERADVAAGLIASLDEPADDPSVVNDAWAREIEIRAKRVLSGDSAGLPWASERARIQRNLDRK
jgi:hypothetical protein